MLNGNCEFVDVDKVGVNSYYFDHSLGYENDACIKQFEESIPYGVYDSYFLSTGQLICFYEKNIL